MPSPPRHTRRSVLFKLGLGLAVALLLLLVAELLLTLAGVAPETFFMVPSGQRLTLRANLKDRVISDPQAGTRFKVSTDADGLRLAGAHRPGATHRILVLGDSIPFGWNLADSQAMPARLQAHLDRLTGGQRSLVINGAQPGYSSLQTLLLLERVGLGRSPTVVVVQTSQHDARPATETDGEQLRGGAAGGLERFLLNRSRTYRLLRRAAPGAATRGAPDDLLPGGLDHAKMSDPPMDLPEEEDDYDTRDYSHGVRVPMGTYRRIIRRLLELSREHGFALVFTNILDWDLAAPYSVALSGEIRGSDARFFDQHKAVRRRLPDAALRLVKDPGHWNARGSDAVAEALASFLIKAGLAR